MLVLFVALAAVGFLIYSLYITVIKRRNTAQEALSSIDVQLRKRHDLVPNIVTLAQKFMNRERELLESITEARNMARADYQPDDPAAVDQHLKAEAGLQAGLMRLFAVAEDYPELGSSDTIITAQQTVNEVEGHISAVHRFYNSAVTDLKNACEIWPMSMIAGMAGVRALPYFEIDESALPADTRFHEPNADVAANYGY